MKVNLAVLSTAVAMLVAAAPVIAHHSFAAEFDADSPMDLTGTVTRVQWMNPHTIFYIDVEANGGVYETWAIELGSPNGLMRRGWTRNSLKIGDIVSVTGSRARDGSTKGNARSVMLSTGRQLFGGSSQPDAEDAND